MLIRKNFYKAYSESLFFINDLLDQKFKFMKKKKVLFNKTP